MNPTTTVWTNADEAQLQALIRQKAEVQSERRAKVERVVDEFYYSDIGSDSIVSALIERADDVVSALQPFMKQVVPVEIKA